MALCFLTFLIYYLTTFGKNWKGFVDDIFDLFVFLLYTPTVVDISIFHIFAMHGRSMDWGMDLLTLRCKRRTT